MSDGASRRASVGAAPTRTGQALLGSLGALANPSAAGLDISKKRTKDEDNNHKAAEERKPGSGAVNKFSAAKLVSVVQETSAPSISRLRKNADNKDAVTSSEKGESTAADKQEDGEIGTSSNSTSRQRTPMRSMSAQNPRTSSRRLRAADHNNLDNSLGVDDDDGSYMDGSSYNMGGSMMDRSVSSLASSRRKIPQRARSAVEGSHTRALQADTRPPRSGRRRPERVEEVDEVEVSPRKSRPLRSKAAEDVPRAYQQRARRPGRRKAGREDDSDSDGIDYSDSDESVEISDSDIEAERDEIDRSTFSQSTRRRLPGRSRSVKESSRSVQEPSRHADRLERRRARRRGTNGEDEDDGSPKRPQIQRSSTTGSGPNPRGARTRGARNTAAELMVVASRERERQQQQQEQQERERDLSPEPSVTERSKGSVSPTKSREQRRRLTMGSVVPEKPKKKEEPWMRRRLQKASGEDSFIFDDAFSADGTGFTNHDSGASGDDFTPNFDAFSQQSTIPKLEKPRK